jgi:single-strand DNA-binding protein
MAYESNFITFVGNVVADPELKYLPNGTAVATFRVASNRKVGEKDETTFMSVTCWRDLAENVGESLAKGVRVVVIGRVKVRSYERDGQTVWVTEIEADEVAPSLRWATTTVTRNTSGTKPVPVADEEPVPF